MKKGILIIGCLIGWMGNPSNPMRANMAYAADWYGQIQRDIDLAKDTPWRARAPYIPYFSVGLGFGFSPNYFAPGNVSVTASCSPSDTGCVQPYVSSNLSLGMSASLSQFGTQGYWSDLNFSVGWGLSKGLTENIGGSQIARETYARDIGLSIGKTLWRERNSGFTLSMGVSGVIPVSLNSRQSTLITSIAPGLSASISFFGRLSLSYSASFNFNFYYQDSGLYNPQLQGIPGLNDRWGMSHSFGIGFTIIRGLSISVGLNIGVGYSFADAYQSPDGPQVFGAENLTAADIASYSINESNGYSISANINYQLFRTRYGSMSLSLGWSNGGSQYVFQFNEQGERVWQIRNPFQLQNNAFSFSIRGGV